MTAQQIRNLNDLMTATMLKGFTTQLSILRETKPISYKARVIPTKEQPAVPQKEFIGATPIEAYCKLADKLRGLFDD